MYMRGMWACVWADQRRMLVTCSITLCLIPFRQGLSLNWSQAGSQEAPVILIVSAWITGSPVAIAGFLCGFRVLVLTQQVLYPAISLALSPMTVSPHFSPSCNFMSFSSCIPQMKEIWYLSKSATHSSTWYSPAFFLQITEFRSLCLNKTPLHVCAYFPCPLSTAGTQAASISWLLLWIQQL